MDSGHFQGPSRCPRQGESLERFRDRQGAGLLYSPDPAKQKADAGACCSVEGYDNFVKQSGPALDDDRRRDHPRVTALVTGVPLRDSLYSQPGSSASSWRRRGPTR